MMVSPEGLRARALSVDMFKSSNVALLPVARSIEVSVLSLPYGECVMKTTPSIDGARSAMVVTCG